MWQKFIIYSIISVSFLVGKSAMAQEDQADKDFYTAIAAHGQKGSLVRSMEKISPLRLPSDQQLEWANNQRFRFAPIKKISNKAEMNEALDSLRKQYAPFLQDLTPNFNEKRQRVAIDRMQLRYETPEDCADFMHLLKGEGKWEEVEIPHYNGPQGISTKWYRAEVTIPESFFKHPAIMLHFNGADYYTDAYINGHHVGSHEGMLDPFEFDIKKYAKPGKNTLLVKIRNDYSMLGGEGTPRFWGNKLAASNSPGWDDPFTGWSCCPAGSGINQILYIEARSQPYIVDLFCRPLPDEQAVEMWLELDLSDGEKADDFVVKYSLFGQNFEARVVDNQSKGVRVEGGRVLNRTRIAIPKNLLRLWTLDAPWLYQMRVALYDGEGKELLDNRKQQFGMRHFELSAQSTPKGRMYLNGEELRLRGTNTMGFLQQDVMRGEWQRLIDDILLAKLTNMNFIRTTQRIVQKEVYEYADRLGMMMQADLPLFAYINQKQYPEILKQASAIERVLRNHPSVVLMTYVNEPMAEAKAHAISREAYEHLFDALDIVVRNENPERAVKYVDGDYQAPSNGYPDNHCYNIWYDQHGVALDAMCRGAWMPISKGWMYGCGEFGAEGLDPADLMKRRYPQEWLEKESDGSWNPSRMRGKHSGEQTYGKHWDWFETQKSMNNWVEESQQHQAWGVQKVARAFRRMPRMNSFAVHLFIDSWPNGWMKAIMDCERTPKQAWFAYRDALTPLAIQIESEREQFFSEEEYAFQVWLCNDSQQNPTGEIRYTLELDGKLLNSGRAVASVPTVTQGSAFQGFLPVVMPKVGRRSKLVVRVGLFDNAGKLLHDESITCSVHPKEKAKGASRFYLLGDSKSADEVIEAFTSKTVTRQGVFTADDVILVSDSKLLQDYDDKLRSAVRAGARVVILKEALASGHLSLNGVEVNAKADDSWTIFRNTGHRWVKHSRSTDLKYNYSSKQNAPERHEFYSFTSEDFAPVLTHRNRSIVAERKDGKGAWIICGLGIDGRLDTTPLLTQIFNRIISDK